MAPPADAVPPFRRLPGLTSRRGLRQLRIGLRGHGRAALQMLMVAAVVGIGLSVASEAFVMGSPARAGRERLLTTMQATVAPASPPTSTASDAESAFKAATAAAAPVGDESSQATKRVPPTPSEIAAAVKKLSEISAREGSKADGSKPAWRPKGNLARDASASSTALVRVTEENSMVAASIVPGMVGWFVGGVWLGGAAFMASSYFSRQKDGDYSDIGQGLRSIGEGALTTVNTGADLADEYEVGNKVGDAFSGMLTDMRTSGNKQIADGLDAAVGGVSSAIEKFDEAVSVKAFVGTVLTTTSEIANQAMQTLASIIEEAMASEADKITKDSMSKKDVIQFKATSGGIPKDS
eukprot:TRINITY_DN13987_c0_g1_i1.p1 TRINITY_DN13987_c0_g1~~TRINITY_DN13987_c0_g1_i1.p1  ORF type:complete len:352 (+),score=93.51 TRINITY_DN13987_c0_g1_i1:80-1135(+)